MLLAGVNGVALRRAGPLALLALVCTQPGCAVHHVPTGPDVPVPALTANVDGIRINCTRAGAAAPGRPTLVLVHGFGASLDTWNDVHDALASDFPVVRIDLKGSGFSDKPDDGHYAVDDQVRLLRRFVQQLGLSRVVLVGHSLGGGIAIETAVANAADTNPADTNPIRIDGLVLIDRPATPRVIPTSSRCCATRSRGSCHTSRRRNSACATCSSAASRSLSA